MRVLVTGLGGELGTRVALLLEARADVEAIVGIDIEPPRRYLTRTDFHRIDPRDRARNVALVREFEPTVVAHVGTYEPNARCSPKAAVERTEADLKAVFPIDTWNRRHLQIIFFGREWCPARNHDLAECPICSWAATKRRVAEESRPPRRR